MNFQQIIIFLSVLAFVLFGIGLFLSIKKHETKMKAVKKKGRLKYSNSNTSK